MAAAGTVPGRRALPCCVTSTKRRCPCRQVTHFCRDPPAAPSALAHGAAAPHSERSSASQPQVPGLPPQAATFMSQGAVPYNYAAAAPSSSHAYGQPQPVQYVQMQDGSIHVLASAVPAGGYMQAPYLNHGGAGQQQHAYHQNGAVAQTGAVVYAPGGSGSADPAVVAGYAYAQYAHPPPHTSDPSRY